MGNKSVEKVDKCFFECPELVNAFRAKPHPRSGRVPRLSFTRRRTYVVRHPSALARLPNGVDFRCEQTVFMQMPFPAPFRSGWRLVG